MRTRILSLDAANLAFDENNWNAARRVTVTAGQDDDATDDAATLLHSASGGGYGSASAALAVRVADDDEPAIMLAPAGLQLARGQSRGYSVRLMTRPSGSVNVIIGGQGNGYMELDTTRLEFTPSDWDEPQTVMATAMDNDDTAETKHTVTVMHTGEGGEYEDVEATLNVDILNDPLTLSIADARAREKEGRLVFDVRLSRPAPERVTVRAETVSGTAREGVDFQSFVGEVVFDEGKQVSRIHVPVLDDAIQEEPETLTVVLSGPRPASVILERAVATGTIMNDDLMPAAWLARFGRTVAGQALDAVTARMAAPREFGLVGEIGGEGIVLKPSAAPAPASPSRGAALDRGSDRRAEPGGSAAGANDETRRAMARVAQAFDGTGGGENMHAGAGTWPEAGTGAEPGSRRSRGIGGTDFLLGSSFALTGVKDPDHGGSLAFWGRAARGSFEGREDTLDLDGEVTTAMLGADYARDRWLVGLALTRSTGKGSYADGGAGEAGRGDVEASLTAAVPYASLQASERVKLWGSLGYGAGDMTLTTGLGETLRADIDWTMAAAGLRADLLEAPRAGPGPAFGAGPGPSLTLTSDALWARTTSDGTRELSASASDVTRLRLGLEGGWTFDLEDGGALTPKLEAGVRHDGGDAETGSGLELGGGIKWTDPGLGLSLDLMGRTLLAHDNTDFEDRGFSGGVAYDPDPASERGPSLTLRREWGGRADGGLNALFADDPLGDRFGPDDGGRDDTGRWKVEGAYGVPALDGRFTGSPHMGLGLAPDSRDMGLGWRLTPEGRHAPDFSFDIDATRRERRAGGPEHGIEAGWGTTGKRALGWRVKASRMDRGGEGPETAVGIEWGLRW